MNNNNPNSASDDVSVFVDTSLPDTNFAVTVSGNDTVSNLKKKLEDEHGLSYGGIKIQSLKVNRKGTLYRLSDFMLVKAAAGVGETECFLFADACIVENFGGVCDNRLVSGADGRFGVLSKRLFGGDNSVPMLLEGNKDEHNGSVDLRIGIKHSDDDHRRTSVDRLEPDAQDDHGLCSDRLEPETQEDRGLCSEGVFRVPTTQVHKGGVLKNEIGEDKSSASLENASPYANSSEHDAKQNSEAMLHRLESENDAPVHGFNEEQLQMNIVPPEDSLGNEGGHVPYDTVVVNRTTTEESSKCSVSDNRSNSGIHGTNDTCRDTEVSGRHGDIRNETSTHCNTTAKDDSQSQATSKKKRKFENITGLEDSLKEKNALPCGPNKEASQQDASQYRNASKKKRKVEKVVGLEKVTDLHNVLACDSNIEAPRPESATEISAGKITSTALDGSLAETSDLLKDSSSRKKNKKKKKKKASDPLQQVADAAPSGNRDMAPISRHDLFEDTGAPILELQGDCKAPSSLDVSNAPGENGTSSAERIQEKREPSQTNDSEAMLSEIQGRKDGNNAELVVASSLHTNEPVTPSKKKKKKKKTKVSSGAEHITDSQFSLVEPPEAGNGEKDSDKAKNEEGDHSKKNGKVISEKDTESFQLVQQADKHDGDGVETSQQVGKPSANAESMKQKSTRKLVAMTKDLQKLEAEEKCAGHQDTDNRTEPLASKRKKSKLPKSSPIDQSNAKCLVSESTKLPSPVQEHISAVMSLEPSLSGNHAEVSSDGEQINFHKYMMPGQSNAEEVTASKSVNNKLKAEMNRKTVDSSGCSWDMQGPLQSQNQGIGGKSAASRSSSIQPQGSISNVDGVLSQPEKTVSKKVSKSGTKGQSSDASGKINSTPKVAGKHNLANGSGVNSLNEKIGEVVATSSSKMEKPYKKSVKHQTGAILNAVASGKTSGGEVLNSSKHKNSSATPVVGEYRNGKSDGKDRVIDSGAITTSSVYSLSSESDYSDGESNAGSSASSGKKDTSRSGYRSAKGGLARRLKNDEIFLNSSVYKKAKVAAFRSQLKENSQTPEIVPDSQPT